MLNGTRITVSIDTPHQYLEEACPKQALRIMQADLSWVAKTDKDEQTHVAARHGFHEVVKWLLSRARAHGLT